MAEQDRVLRSSSPGLVRYGFTLMTHEALKTTFPFSKRSGLTVFTLIVTHLVVYFYPPESRSILLVLAGVTIVLPFLITGRWALRERDRSFKSGMRRMQGIPYGPGVELSPDEFYGEGVVRPRDARDQCLRVLVYDSPWGRIYQEIPIDRRDE